MGKTSCEWERNLKKRTVSIEKKELKQGRKSSVNGFQWIKWIGFEGIFTRKLG